MLIQNNKRGCPARGVPFSRPWEGAWKRVWGKAGEGSLSGNVLGKRLRKGSREKCLGTGPWERLSQKPFGESVSSKSSGNAFGGRVSRNHIGKAPWNVVRGIFLEKVHRKSVWVTQFGEDSRKGIGRTVLGAFSGKTFRKCFEERALPPRSESSRKTARRDEQSVTRQGRFSSTELHVAGTARCRIPQNKKFWKGGWGPGGRRDNLF